MERTPSSGINIEGRWQQERMKTRWSPVGPHWKRGRKELRRERRVSGHGWGWPAFVFWLTFVTDINGRPEAPGRESGSVYRRHGLKGWKRKGGELTAMVRRRPTSFVSSVDPLGRYRVRAMDELPERERRDGRRRELKDQKSKQWLHHSDGLNGR